MKKLFGTLKWLGTQIRPFAAVMPFIVAAGILLSLLGVSIAVISKSLIDAAAARTTDLAVRTAIIFIAVIILQIILDAVQTVLSTRTQEALANRIRQKLFDRIALTSWMDFTGYHSEDILTRMTSDTAAVTNGLVSILPGMVSLGTRFVAAFATLMVFEPVLAVLAFVLGPVSVLFSRFFVGKLKSMHIKIQEAEGIYRACMHEALSNMLIIKTFSLEQETGERIEKLQNERLNWIIKRSRLSAVSNSALSFSYWTGYFLAFIWGALRLSAGAITFGTLTAFLQLAGQVQGPVVSLARTIPHLISMIASAERLMEFETLQAEKEAYDKLSWESAGILFENISFSYDNEKTVLKDISFEILPADTAVIIGPSGEGKTTVIRLMLALIKSNKGKVCFTHNAGEECEASASTRSLISYVPQGNTLFSGTIRDNLLIGNADADDNEIEMVLRAACAWDFTAALPEGLDTRIGERGIGLSEGQAQRLAIARAFLRKTPIIIFDEATSALDVETESTILQSLGRLMPARTCIIISHRPAALKVCNRVLKLEDGNIIEYVGSFDRELIGNAG